MSRRKKSTLPPVVQKQLDQIVTPSAVTITLHDDHIGIIRRYRVTKAAYDQAVTTAEAHTENGVWTMADLAAVEETLKEHQVSELEMAIVFASLARKAGL
jgi:fumarate hydratase class II